MTISQTDGKMRMRFSCPVYTERTKPSSYKDRWFRTISSARIHQRSI